MRNALADRRAVTVAAWCPVVVLATIGIGATVFRGLTLFGALDVIRAERLAQTLAMRLGVSLSAAELAAYDVPFVDHPFVTAMHVIPAFLFMTLAPLQFSSTIRNRHLRFHRWSGRVLVLLGVLFATSGFFFGLRTPFGGRTEALGVALFGALFLVALVKALVAIRKGDVIVHQKWMTRAFGVVLGISMMRIALSILVAVTGSGVQPVFGIAVWIGFVITTGAAELWIRYGPAARETVRRALPAAGVAQV